MKNNYIFIGIMAFIVGLIIILAIALPLRGYYLSKNDRLIEENIYYVTRSISDYYATNNKLPNTLNDITVTGNGKALITKNLLQYTPEGDESVDVDDIIYTNSSKTYGKYQICATYVSEKNGYYDYYDQNNNEYREGVDTYNHPAGKVCYKLRTSPSYDFQ